MGDDIEDLDNFDIIKLATNNLFKQYSMNDTPYDKSEIKHFGLGEVYMHVNESGVFHFELGNTYRSIDIHRIYIDECMLRLLTWLGFLSMKYIPSQAHYFRDLDILRHDIFK